MDLILSLELNDSQSQRYEYASPEYEKVRESRKRIDDLSSNTPINNLCQRTRNKKVYPSPLWRRDSTNRLQRKPLRKSTSFESAIDQIGGSESLLTDYEDSIWNSTHMNDSSPRWQRVEYECLKQPRRNLMPVQNHIFNSTMKNGYSRKTVPEINTNPDPLLENSPANNRRNQTGKLKIFNSWISWTPFWSRDNDSKRLDRRHYVTDFLDPSMDY